jgi:hypothetical protein
VLFRHFFADAQVWLEPWGEFERANVRYRIKTRFLELKALRSGQLIDSDNAARYFDLESRSIAR